MEKFDSSLLPSGGSPLIDMRTNYMLAYEAIKYKNNPNMKINGMPAMEAYNRYKPIIDEDPGGRKLRYGLERQIDTKYSTKP